MKLIEQGKLSLDIDINTYLKSWKFPYDSVSKGNKITIANLLNHRAGLSVSGFGGYEQGQNLPTIIQILNGEKPANSSAVQSIFEPDLKFKYSGGGTTISQLILENTTDKSYEEYMQNNILNPLGMLKSSFIQPPIHENKILSKELSLKRLENDFGVFTQNYNGTKYFGHSGGNYGFVCHYVGSFENGNGIAVMTNGNNMNLVYEIVKSVASLNNWENFPLEPIKESIYLTIRKVAKKNVNKGIKLYKKLKKEQPNLYNFSSENELNVLGYEFLKGGNIDSAIKIFNLNVNEFPTYTNAYDSRGEAYFNKKNYQLALKDYQKVLDLDPSNQNVKEMISKINQIISLKILSK